MFSTGAERCLYLSFEGTSRARLREYERHTPPLLEHLRLRGIPFHDIEVVDDLPEMDEKMTAALEAAGFDANAASSPVFEGSQTVSLDEAHHRPILEIFRSLPGRRGYTQDSQGPPLEAGFRPGEETAMMLTAFRNAQ